MPSDIYLFARGINSKRVWGSTLILYPSSTNETSEVQKLPSVLIRAITIPPVIRYAPSLAPMCRPARVTYLST